MRRLIAIVLVLLVPLQSSLAAVVPIAGLPQSGCDPVHTASFHDAAGRTTIQTHPLGGCIAGWMHGGHHGHSCPLFGGFAVAVGLPRVPTDSVSSPLPHAEPARFQSIVLDVPRPPPTASI